MAGAVAFAQSPKDFLPLDDYLLMWKISKQFTHDVADKMPADQYSFKATPQEMSLGGLLIHIAVSTVFRFSQISGAKTPFSIPELQKKQLTKDEVLKLLDDSFDYAIDLIPKMTPEQLSKPIKVDWKGRPEATGRTMMLNMFTHVAHHRAQAEVYLRLKGIEPPVYTF